MANQPQMWPFFCMFGGKWRSAPHYPQPQYEQIIEPFAGAAGYALRHHESDVILYEADPEIHGMWVYLLGASSADILALPAEVNGSVDTLDEPRGAKDLIAFWLNKGGTTAKKSASAWARSGIRPKSYWGAEIRERIASQVDRVRHWQIVLGDYSLAPDIEVTWFIDPPYAGPPGRLYRHRIADYTVLADWCRTRRGQVMVCERDGSDWLPFEAHRTIKATPGSRGGNSSTEVLWMNDALR